MDYTGSNSGVAFITGAGSGIGQATALLFLRAGVSKLALVDLALKGLEDSKALLEAEAGSASATLQILLLPTDVSSEIAVDSAVASAAKEFGRIDFCVNSAGLNQQPRALLHETTMEAYDRVVNVNQRGLFLCQRAQVRQMLSQPLIPTRDCDAGRRGSIVNIASNAGISAKPHMTPYAASKAAAITITRTDSQGYAAEGIRINAVAPGVILTPMNKSSIEAGENFSTYIDGESPGAPVKRVGVPDEIAHAVLFLTHPLSTFIIGHVMVVDGGYTL
ncbi:3-oxoacyl-[acyl-carrier-protein] reductase FabG [Pseudohyphozyma bogoriensis]|nr:3-oxoacyl-[acyl-carrier-protein] reductase FabG [Pseudohyphozyma bogoriensis]